MGSVRVSEGQKAINYRELSSELVDSREITNWPNACGN